jgi:hypothetical protein
MYVCIPLEALYVIKKPHQYPLGSFKDLIIGIDRGKRLCFIPCSDYHFKRILYLLSVSLIYGLHEYVIGVFNSIVESLKPR